MIADSPYRTSEPLLTPGEGALAGAVASVCMLAAISVLNRLSGLSGVDLLIRIGQATVPRATALGPSVILLVGGVVHTLIGAALGTLYAVCQDRAPAGTLVAVGVFYGVVIWVVSRVITGWLFGSVFRTVFHSYAWFVACLLYGVLLGGWAAWVNRRRPQETRAVPVD